jgi:integrase
MSTHIKSNHGRLLLRIKYRGTWREEYLGLNDNRDNRREAERLAREIAAEIRSGSFDYAPRFPESKNLTRLGLRPTDADLTLGNFGRRWLTERAPLLKPISAASYAAALRNHVLAHPIAAMPLAAITDGDVNTLIGDLKCKPGRAGAELSARAVNMVLARLRTIFATAYRRKLIGQNPMDYVDNLRQPKPDVDPFDLNEALRLCAAESWEHALLSVLLFTALRPNEALALIWPDIDWEHGLIRVRRALAAAGAAALPKTPGSERDVEMPDAVRAALQEQRARSQLKGDLVFPSANGTPIDLNNFRARNWPRILRHANVRARPLYQCRHTCARLLLEQGDTPQHVAAQLGHSSLRMLFAVYGRWLARPQSEGIAQLDAAIQAARYGDPSPTIHPIPAGARGENRERAGTRRNGLG